MQSFAKKAIGILLRAIAGAAQAQGIQFLLNKIRVTDCFEDDVNRLLNERSGLTAYVAARNNAHAIGRTLWICSEQGDISFAVIIDTKQIGSWRLNNPRCLTTVLHELIHIFMLLTDFLCNWHSCTKSTLYAQFIEARDKHADVMGEYFA